mgnify:FL=1
MNVYEREYFVSRLRSGIVFVKLDGVTIHVKTPKIEDMIYSDDVFLETFNECKKNGVQTEEEMNDWMLEKGFWSEEKEEKVKDLEKGIENLKVDIFESRANTKRVRDSRMLLRAAEKTLSKHLAEKNSMFPRTCEGVATEAKNIALFERCSYIGDELVDFEFLNIGSLFYQYSKSHLTEPELREIARNDPWRLCWNVREHSSLFRNDPERELSADQKGLLLWARMYDNIQESMDCPTAEVIADDDMLDGWFIVQRRKNKQEKAQAEIENKLNEKVSNSDEVLVVTDSAREAEHIHSMNTPTSNAIRQQRMQHVKSQGRVEEEEFQDRKLEFRAAHNQALKDRTRR